MTPQFSDQVDASVCKDILFIFCMKTEAARNRAATNFAHERVRCVGYLAYLVILLVLRSLLSVLVKNEIEQYCQIYSSPVLLDYSYISLFCAEVTANNVNRFRNIGMKID